MGGKPSNLNAWAQVDEGKARKMVFAAIKKAKGDRHRAAVFLGVSYVTLWRHVRSLRIVDEVDAICDQFSNADRKANNGK